MNPIYTPSSSFGTEFHLLFPNRAMREYMGVFASCFRRRRTHHACTSN
jgi:hypothetical protein